MNGIIYVIVFALTFVAAFSLFHLSTQKERKMRKNLDLLTISSPDEDTDSKDASVDEDNWVAKLYNNYYNNKFLQANLRITLAEFKTYLYVVISISIVSVIVVGVLIGPAFAALSAPVIGAVLWKGPDVYIENKKHKRKLAINAQKSDILSIMSSCSSSQMPLDKTFKTLSERLKAPADAIFLEAYSLMKVGNTAEDVLRHLKQVFDSNEFNFLLSAYEVWLENQGSLQDTYKIVSISIRDKEEIDMHMQGFVSKAKTTIIVLIVISVFFVMLSLAMIADIFIPFARSFLGQVCIALSFVIVLGGIYMVNKIKNDVKY